MDQHKKRLNINTRFCMRSRPPQPVTLTPEQFKEAELCLHSLLQCIYGAPIHHGVREYAFVRCHATAAQCYQKVTTPAQAEVPGYTPRQDPEQIDPLCTIHS